MHWDIKVYICRRRRICLLLCWMFLLPKVQCMIKLQQWLKAQEACIGCISISWNYRVFHVWMMIFPRISLWYIYTWGNINSLCCTWVSGRMLLSPSLQWLSTSSPSARATSAAAARTPACSSTCSGTSATQGSGSCTWAKTMSTNLRKATWVTETIHRIEMAWKSLLHEQWLIVF